MARYTDADYDRERGWDSNRGSDYDPGYYGRNRNSDRYNYSSNRNFYSGPASSQNYSYDRGYDTDRGRDYSRNYGSYNDPYGRGEREYRSMNRGSDWDARDEYRNRDYNERNDSWRHRGSRHQDWENRDYDRSSSRYERDNYDTNRAYNDWGYYRSSPTLAGRGPWDRHDRDRNYSSYRDRDHGRDHDRGFWDRAGDKVRSWFGDEEAGHRDERIREGEWDEGRRSRRTERRREYEPYDVW
jgi:hypothetical protein